MSKNTSSHLSNSNPNRIAAMKEAFQRQYKSQFTAATDTKWAGDESKSNEQSQETKRKKSRWD